MKITKQALIAIFILFIIVILVNVFFPISLKGRNHKGIAGHGCDAECERRKTERRKEKEKNQRVKGAPTEKDTVGRRIARRVEVWNWHKKDHNTSEAETYQQHRHDDKTDTRKSDNFNLNPSFNFNRQLSGIFQGGGIGFGGGLSWR